MTAEILFTQWLKQQRKVLDLTQAGLAERIGCSVKTIEKIESGERRPSKQLVGLLAQCLGISEEEYATFAQLARPLAPVAASKEIREERVTAYIDKISPDGTQNLTPRNPTNLPAQLNSFVGRSTEIARTRLLLQHGPTRLLVYTGPPGVGKTRLSLQAASTLLGDFEHGIFFVSLASISEPSLIVTAIAKTLDVREKAREPLLGRLKEYLRDKRILLLLDNFEQVVEAAPLLVEMLAEAPNLKMLVTSRHSLHVYGEYNFPIAPLSVPDPATIAVNRRSKTPPRDRDHDVQGHQSLLEFEAIKLFLARADAASPGFEILTADLSLTAEICRTLSGLPLAIELAAARVKFSTAARLLSQLQEGILSLSTVTQNLPERQRNVRSAIAWSYALLNEAEQRLFRRISIFSKGFTEESLFDILTRVQIGSMQNCAPSELTETISGETGAVVESLLDKSLLQQKLVANDTITYEMFEAIREYAAEKLEASGEAYALRWAEAGYYLSLAERADIALKGPEQSAWLAKLMLEHDNIRSVLIWLKEQGRAGNKAAVEMTQRIACALVLFWLVRGYWSEGRYLLGEVLSLHEENDNSLWRAKCLLGAGFLAWEQGDYLEAWGLYEQSLYIFRILDDKRGMAETLRKLGLAATLKGDYQAARKLYKEGLGFFREIEDTPGVAALLYSLGKVTRFQGEFALSRESYAESLRLFQELGDVRQASYALIGLAAAALEQGDYGEAKSLFAQSLSNVQELGDDHGVVSALTGLGEAARCMGDYQAAYEYNEQSLTILRKLSDKWRIITSLHNLAHIACKQGDYKRARALYVEAFQLSQEVGNKQHLAYCLSGLAVLAARAGRYLLSANLMGASEKQLVEMGAYLQAADRVEYEEVRKVCAEELGLSSFTDALEAGQLLTPEQAIGETSAL